MQTLSITFKNHPLFEDQMIDLNESEIILLIGDNGIGKSLFVEECCLRGGRCATKVTPGNDFPEAQPNTEITLSFSEEDIKLFNEYLLQERINIEVDIPTIITFKNNNKNGNLDFEVNNSTYSLPNHPKVFFNNFFHEISSNNMYEDNSAYENFGSGFILRRSYMSKDPIEKLKEHIEQHPNPEEDKRYIIDSIKTLSGIDLSRFVNAEDNAIGHAKTYSAGEFQIAMNSFYLALALSETKESKWLLIEEPENFLNPKLQKEYIERILYAGFSKRKTQIQKFITSHSPYVVQSIFNYEKNNSKLKILRFNKKEDGKVCISDVKLESATFNEINYLAFDFPTPELHNELYGDLQEKAIKETENNCHEKGFDEWLVRKLKTKPLCTWKKVKKDQSIKEQNRTIQTYIRNSIHHPENKENKLYSDQDLKSSIESMINLRRQLE